MADFVGETKGTFEPVQPHFFLPTHRIERQTTLILVGDPT